jgi:asparagine synthase (glutamine-hydrolysing)
MCGIVGQFCYRGIIDRAEFVQMRDTLTHRGPDGEGAYFDATEQMALGHRRLAFLDLSESGRQPMANEDETLWITFNGEIYNYVELRSVLEGKGHRFRSASDTETILHGYEEWGADVLGHLKGMFALGIYDVRRREVFLARDRFGIKPLYYYQDPSTFMFASELKALLASKRMRRMLRYESIHDYLAYRFVPSPWSIWRNVFKVPPANYLLHRPDGTVTVREYWRPPIDGNVVEDRETAVERVDQLLKESVAVHLRSDVPIGAFLSGGYDSSALVQYMHRLGYPRRTFAIGFEGWEGSEHKYAGMVADRFEAEHTNFILDQCSLTLVEKLMHFYDEPIADISIIPTYQVSQVASQSVKAVLSGDGADEMFCGYTWHREFSQDPAHRVSKLDDKEFTELTTSRYGEYMAMGRFRNPEIRRLLHPDIAPREGADADWWYRSLCKERRSPIKAMQYLDIKSFMAELVLTKVDRATMAHSLEARVPFLDHQLYEYVVSLNDSVYYDPRRTKALLHHILEPVLPKAILDRPKQGFVGPNRYYMSTDFYSSVIRDGRLLKDHVIQRPYVDELIKANDCWRLWKIMVLEFWYQRWMQPGLTLREPPTPVLGRRARGPSYETNWVGTEGFSLRSALRKAIGKSAPLNGGPQPDQVHPTSAYIICTTQCAGATLLGKGLADKGVGNPQEFLLCHDRDRWSSSPPRWLTNASSTKLLTSQHPQTVRQYLNVVRSQGNRGDVFGLVLMWSYFRKSLKNLRLIREFRGRSDKEILDAAFGNPRFLWLKRREPLEQAAAWYHARETGDWSEEPGQMNRSPLGKNDLKKLEAFHKMVLKAQEGWGTFFEVNGITPLEVSYEDLVGDYQATLQQALDFVAAPLVPGGSGQLAVS